jgi:Icc-related predicted phosphoesterase
VIAALIYMPPQAMTASNIRDKWIPTRILIISDTHGRLPYPAESADARNYAFHSPLPDADVLIHCGDLTMNSRIAEHQNALTLIKSINADLKIVIPGNHDITLDREYYARHPLLHAAGEAYSPSILDEIQEMYTGPQARAANVHYLVEGTAEFELKNGARLRVYASAYQPEFCDWAFGYPRSMDRYNPRPEQGETATLNPVPDHGEVDIMLTHGPPKGILDLNWNSRLQRPEENCGCEHLRCAVERCRPLLHCFGHIHESWGAVHKQWDVESRGGILESLSRRVKAMRRKGSQEGEENEAEDSDSPFHPTRNPNTNYMPIVFRDDPPTKAAPGETLMVPGSYAGFQVPEMCAHVDARNLTAGEETLFVNASIMTLRYEPKNAPWLVDLMLPVAGGGEGAEGHE